MLFGLPVAIAMLAEAASASTYGPKPPVPPKPVVKASTVDRCAAAKASADTRVIVVCAERPQGYRLNPDVMAAKREYRSGGRPTPSEKFVSHDCATVGPMGCRGGPTINLLAAAATLAEMGDRLSKGKEIGSMFQTDPHPSEYQLYVEAKRRREAKEAEAAAKAKAKAQQAAAVIP
jgi:hypothetical protein